MKRIGLILSILFLFINIKAQDSVESKPFIKNLKPIIGIQFWSTYSINHMVFDESTNGYLPVDNRIENNLRRSRIGVKGDFSESLSFNITGAIDLIGKDILASTFGGVNNGASPAFRVWNMYTRWKVDKSEKLNLTFGYQVPVFSREHLIGAFDYSSFDKSISQFYTRRLLVGTNPGRAMGLNVGGLLNKEGRFVNYSYDFGLFTPVFHTYEENSTGSKFSPLLLGKLNVHLGDPEKTSYSAGYVSNFMNKRKGLTLGIWAAHQGQTDIFDYSTGYGLDFVFNYGHFNLDGEFSFGQRKLNENTSDFATAFLRAGYNIQFKQYVIEPVIMSSVFNGANTLEDQIIASTLDINSGSHELLELGLNFHVNPKIKFSLFYHLQDGEIGELSSGSIPNDYFEQGDLGPIRRGNFIGLGLNVRY
jgi:hypothetical protein